MNELSDFARMVPNICFSAFGIYMAHTFYKTPRKLLQCILAWLGIYIFWIIAGIPLDAIFVGNPDFPGVTHERVCMFIGPAAIVVYKYIFPQITFCNAVFCYFMVDNCMILLIILARTLSEVVCALLPLGYDFTMILIYLLLACAFLLLYRLKLLQYVRRVLDSFSGSDMKLLALFAVLAYFGTLFVTDVWAPWENISYKLLLHNFSVVLLPVCGYGLTFRIVAEHGHSKQLERHAGYDFLTGLKNRYSLFEDAKKLLNNGGGFYILLSDLDSFKKINDIYGHAIGDEYLRKFAAAASGILVSDGELYRIGGDEFVALYFGKDTEKICAEMKNGFKKSKDFPEFHGISIGSVRVSDFEELDAAIAKADELMYRDKVSKKNYAR